MKLGVLTLLILLAFSFNSYSQLPFDWYECGIYKPGKIDLSEIASDPLGILRIKRNQVLAFYGRTFKDSLLQKYFEGQSWYRSGPSYNDTVLTEDDIYNIKMIKNLEEKIRKKFRETKEVTDKISRFRKLGLSFSTQMRYLDITDLDIDNDNKQEVFVLSIPWAFLNINGNIDPGDYTSIEVYKGVDRVWKKLPIYSEDEKGVLEEIEYVIGMPIDGIPKGLNGTSYIKFADKNQNGFLELYLQEARLASNPDKIYMLEYQNDSLRNIFISNNHIREFKDLNGDGVDEIVAGYLVQLYSIIPELYPDPNKVYQYISGQYRFNKSSTIEYHRIKFEKSLTSFEREKTFENYIQTLKHLLRLMQYKDENALENAKKIVDKYNHLFEGRKSLHFGEAKFPEKQKVLEEIQYKVESSPI